MVLDQTEHVANVVRDVRAGVGVRDRARSEAVSQRRRVEAGANDGSGVAVGAHAVGDHVEHVVVCEVAGGPDVRLAHGCTVATRVLPAAVGVRIPQCARLAEVLGRCLGGSAAAEGVGGPYGEFDPSEGLHIESAAADRPAHSHPKLRVIGPAPAGSSALTPDLPPTRRSQSIRWSRGAP